MRKLFLLILLAGCAVSSITIKAEENEVYEMVVPNFYSSVSNDSASSDSSSHLQDNEVLTGEVESNEESTEYDPASDPDNGQLVDLVEMLRHDLVTYMNFSYKMQVCTVAMLALIAGGNVAAAIFNHFVK